MAEKYYAVKEGAVRGIFRTWEECRASVSGYSGAVYKSFKTKEEALDYLKGAQPHVREKSSLAGETNIHIGSDEPVRIYVDGSYNSATGEFSYGMVVLTENGQEKYNGRFRDQELAVMRNVAGEIKGAEAAMQYALDRQIPAITIYHDYEGIARWCLGEWKANKEGTRAYREFYHQASRQVDITFVKVEGHSNNKYNDMADELAKEALLPSNDLEAGGCTAGKGKAGAAQRENR